MPWSALAIKRTLYDRPNAKTKNKPEKFNFVNTIHETASQLWPHDHVFSGTSKQAFTVASFKDEKDAFELIIKFSEKKYS